MTTRAAWHRLRGELGEGDGGAGGLATGTGDQQLAGWDGFTADGQDVGLFVAIQVGSLAVGAQDDIAGQVVGVPALEVGDKGVIVDIAASVKGRGDGRKDTAQRDCRLHVV